jgi:hypothetical protein
MLSRRHRLVEVFEEIRKSSVSRCVDQVLKVMSGDELINRIAGMEWDIVDAAKSPNQLLTSDRPVVVVRNERTNGNTVLALPVTRHKLFVAAGDRRLIADLQRTPARQLTDAMKAEVVFGATKFVFGSSDAQLRFVQNRFGMGGTSSSPPSCRKRI